MAQPPKHPLAAPQNLPGKPPAKPSGFKASKVVTITGIGVVSLLLVGYCSAQQDYEEVGAECVDLNSRQPDGTYEVVDEDLCDDNRYHGSRGAYSWYYGGVRSGAYIQQGTTVRPSDVKITSRKGTVIQRGGFGGRSGSGGGS
ncbi:hypothetical protein OG884_04730 [Streptosporangium sp. NBC_01755]|uniref:hypothetical protein n=1 Tax=unclassified Streptosporangium TaxID=2632669 RepID=UPI002DDB243A|nr:MULTISPECIES: hypothetical protein [unclassified Streptosporangium]WSA27202.1 hypothetical protein OIE13_04795 [Streptosporangium sp. NBC_01810]WSD01244.1 hypothetical protein OG884_04730 [Streptosporangium sp. NBC_01755]